MTTRARGRRKLSSEGRKLSSAPENLSPEIDDGGTTSEGDVFDKVWAFFSSVKLAIVLIIAICIASLIGALLVQAPGGIANDQTQYGQWLNYIRGKYGTLTDIYSRLGFFNVYNALWFKLLLATLSFNIIICTANRIPGIWQAYRKPKIRMNDAFYNSVPIRSALRVKGEAVEALESALVRKRYQVKVEEIDGATYVYGDKNGWAKLGTIATHLSLILLLAGAILGGIYGFADDGVTIVEGETYNVGRGTDFSIRNDKFAMELYPDGRPKDYRSDLVVIQNGKEVAKQTIRVNEPLEYEGIRFHQSFYGPAPVVQVKDTKSGSVLLSEAVPLTSSGDGYSTGYFEVPGTNSYASLGAVPGSSSASANVALQVYSGSSQSASFSGMLQPGQPKVVGDQEYTLLANKQFTGLRMVKDPGVPIVWMASALMIIGVCATFYLPRRRVWAKVTPGNISMAGVADKLVIFQPEFDKLVGEIRNG